MNLFQLLFGDWIKLLFDFGGRINRAKYWQTVVIYLVGLLVLYILAVVVAAVIGIPQLATLFVLLAGIPVAFHRPPSESSACTTATGAAGGC